MKKILIQYLWIIGIVALLFLIAGCKTMPTKSEPKKPNVYDGSMGKVLGCVFSPTTCKNDK